MLKQFKKVKIGSGNAERQMQEILTKVKEGINNIETNQPVNLETLDKSFNVYCQMLDEGNMLLEGIEESFRNDFENEIRKWREILKNEFIKFFKIPTSLYHKVEKGKDRFNDMENVIVINERAFKDKIEEAAKYFGGGFLDQKLFCNPIERDMESKLPMTIKEILDVSIVDWQNLIMENGIPIPYYHFLYNNNLPYIIDRIM